MLLKNCTNASLIKWTGLKHYCGFRTPEVACCVAQRHMGTHMWAHSKDRSGRFNFESLEETIECSSAVCSEL